MSEEDERLEGGQVDADIQAQRELLDEAHREGEAASQSEEEAAAARIAERKEGLRERIEAERKRIAEGGQPHSLYGSSQERSLEGEHDRDLANRVDREEGSEQS